MLLDFPDIKELKFIKHLGGSTGASLHEDSKGTKWVLKKAEKGAGYEQIHAEYLANMCYRACGISVPECKLYTSEEALLLEFIDGILLKDATVSRFKDASYELQDGFIIDALLANWDVIGLYRDNIMLTSKDYIPIRIDNGGSFTYKATGGPKEFRPIVTELDTMRNKSINPSAAAVFGQLTEENDILPQIEYHLKPNVYEIMTLFDGHPLKNTMRQRIDYLLEYPIWLSPTAAKKEAVAEVLTPEYIEDVQKGLLTMFDKPIDILNKTLLSHKAIVSGGGILKFIGAFKDSKSVDIDIYVPTEKAGDFRTIMSALFKAETSVVHVASESEQSFFKKNSIASVTKYSKSKPTYMEMDIVEVADEKSPIEVVKHFDLTVCENWYDGKNVYMVYPEHVQSKHGFLENNYLGLYYKQNAHTFKRLKKYVDRGFSFSIHNPKTGKDTSIMDAIQAFTEPVPTIPAAATKPVRGVYVPKYPIDISSVTIRTSIESVPRNSQMNSKNMLTIVRESKPTDTVPPPGERSMLSDFEWYSIREYTNKEYIIANTYLYDNKFKIYPAVTIPIIEALKIRFLAEKDETAEHYMTCLVYYYIVNLYNGIQKGPKLSPPQPFMVYRAAKTHYLNTDTGYFSYMNSFVSTTYTKNIILTFGVTKYTFIIHPACRYMNIENISIYKKEKEVLFTPYHRYICVSSDPSNLIFAILPTDLEIPKTFDEFHAWKSNVHMRTSVLTGGRIASTLLGGPTATMRSTRRNNRRTAKLNTRKRKNTAHRNRKMESQPPAHTRFTDAIPSFPGKEPTAEEKKVIQAMLQYFQTLAKN